MKMTSIVSTCIGILTVGLIGSSAAIDEYRHHGNALRDIKTQSAPAVFSVAYNALESNRSNNNLVSSGGPGGLLVNGISQGANAPANESATLFLLGSCLSGLAFLGRRRNQAL